jgi:hypothetical protein
MIGEKEYGRRTSRQKASDLASYLVDNSFQNVVIEKVTAPESYSKKAKRKVHKAGPVKHVLSNPSEKLVPKGTTEVVARGRLYKFMGSADTASLASQYADRYYDAIVREFLEWDSRKNTKRFGIFVAGSTVKKNPVKMHKYESFMRDGSHIFYNAARGSWLYFDKRGRMINSVSDEIFPPETPISKIKRHFVTVKKNPIDPEITNIVYRGANYEIYRAFPTLETAEKYARLFSEAKLGKSLVRDLGTAAGRLRYALFVSHRFKGSPAYINKNPRKHVPAHLKKTALYAEHRRVFEMHPRKQDWYVDRKSGNVWEPVAAFKDKQKAIEYANAYAKQHDKQMKIYRP